MSPGPKRRAPHCGYLPATCGPWLLAVLLLGPGVWAAPPPAAEAPAEDKDLIPFEWPSGASRAVQILRSEHFIVYSDAEARLARRLAQRLESTYTDVARFCRVNKFPARALAQPLEVIFFEHPEVYHGYAATVDFQSAGTLGFFHADTNRSVFFNSENDPRLAKVRQQIAQAREKLERRKVAQLEGLLRSYEAQVNQMVVQHESAHMILYNLGVHSAGAANPMWLVEGLAMLFEPAPTDRGSGFGITNEFRLFDFREALRDGREVRQLKAEDFDRAVAAGIMVDLPTLVSDPEIWKTQGPLANNYYAQAWALTHYLQRRQPQPWAAYLQTIAARRPQGVVTPAEELLLFEKTFVPLDEKFTQRWANYILRLPAPRVLAKID